jgi:hypothetical protein
VNWVDLWGLEQAQGGGGSGNSRGPSIENSNAQINYLISAQDATRNAHMYQKGGGGRYPSATNADSTFCNQATFDIAEATGFNTSALYNGVSRDNVNANGAGNNLALAATNGLVNVVSPASAQALANTGYTVIASWINPTGERGHMATVRPTSNPLNSANGPMVSNVGLPGATGIVSAKTAFTNDNLADVKYYYDPKQTQYYDPSGIAQRQEKQQCAD